MGYGFKRGGSGVFKSGANIVTNPNAIITATLSTDTSISYSAVANSKGIAYLEVKKRGTYYLSVDGIDTSECVLSTVPASVSTVLFDKSNTVQTVNHVYVGDISDYSVGGYSTNKAFVAWNAPTAFFSGVNVRKDTDGAPTTPTTGTQISVGKGDKIEVTAGDIKDGITNGSLTAGTTYYFGAWAYYTHPNGTTFYGSANHGSWTARTYSVNREFTANGKFTIPEGIRSITVFCCGGGGSGSAVYNRHQGGSGGGGGFCNRKTVSVVPNQEATITIGDGGAAVSATKYSVYVHGNNGKATTFSCNGETVSADGGGGGIAASYVTSGSARGGGNGGSGGGAGAWSADSSSGTSYYGAAGAGGSNGSGGGSAVSGSRNLVGGNGQGASVVTFNGKVYAGGGGGGYGGDGRSPSASGGTRGGGAGGSSFNTSGASGTAGTGGGGGGSAAVDNSEQVGRNCTSGSGGSGACVIYAAS